MTADRRGVARPDLAAARLYTAVVSDILDGLGHRDHILDPAIRLLGGAADVVVAGWANPFLVAEAGEIPAEPYAGEIAALDDLAPGEVVLVAAGGSARAACWGELFSTAARARGARGTVIDGYCRDQRRIMGMGYPVWCRGGLPLDCKRRTAVTAWRQPAVVGGLLVQPGDLVVADVDGVVVVPAGLGHPDTRATNANAVRSAVATAVAWSDVGEAYVAAGLSMPEVCGPARVPCGHVATVGPLGRASCSSFAPMSARRIALAIFPTWVRGSTSMSSRRSGHLYLARPLASR